VAQFVTRVELERQIGQQRVLDFFDDDRSGDLNDDEVANLEEILSETNDVMVSALVHKGWEQSGLNALARDRSLRRAARQIAAQLAGQRKPELFDADGLGPFHPLGEIGRKTLKEFAKGESRSRLEANGAGKNASLRGRVSPSDPVTLFGRDPSDPSDAYGDGRGF